MIKDIQAVQSEFETKFIQTQPMVDNNALKLLKQDKDQMIKYLTDYSMAQTALVIERWRELGERLITKYNDGYLIDETGEPAYLGYPDEWLRSIIKRDPDRFYLQKVEPEPGSEP